MITRIEGTLIEREASALVVDVHGLGYRVEVSSLTAESMAVSQTVCLHTHLILRDDGIALYGFQSKEERQLFFLLLAVQSVGPKVALAVLGGATLAEIVNAVVQGNSQLFQATPGVGKRTAERILLELQPKISDLGSQVGIASSEVKPLQSNDIEQVAQDGLIQLGFSPTEASTMLKGLSAATAEELITAALRTRHHS